MNESSFKNGGPGVAAILKSDVLRSPLRSLKGRTIFLADRYDVTIASHCQ